MTDSVHRENGMNINESGTPDITEADASSFDAFVRHEGDLFAKAVREGDLSGAVQSLNRLMALLEQMVGTVAGEIDRRCRDGARTENPFVNAVMAEFLKFLKIRLNLMAAFLENSAAQKNDFLLALQEGQIAAAAEIHAGVAAQIVTLAGLAFSEPDISLSGTAAAPEAHQAS